MEILEEKIMGEQATRTAKGPTVNLSALNQTKLLQVHCMTYESQLRNFTPLRDRLVAAGKDANAAYRNIQARRDTALDELKRISPPLVVPNPAGKVRGPGPVGLTPASPINRFRLPPIGPGFGYSGTVPVGFGFDGAEVVPEGEHYAALGSIYTVTLNNQGVVFDGRLIVEPEPGAQTNDDGGLDYCWMHNWLYVIDFPAAAAKATFTYAFNVQAYSNVWLRYGDAMLYTFVSIGESASYTGQQIEVNTGVGWPFVVDLTQPYSANGSQYNGFYHMGYTLGQLTVQRSLIVEAGDTPGVAVVLGVATAQSSESAVTFDTSEGEGGSLNIASLQNEIGLVNFSYSPLPLTLHP
ncbi:MAG: hypothetical protein WA405_13030 [Candidatus Acidiferrales bacterium]